MALFEHLGPEVLKDIMRLYIADDNIEFAEFCAKVAKQEGWQVSICADGTELVDILKLEDTPALVIIDIQMPNIDGIEVIDCLQAINRDLRLRFITGGPQSSALAARMIADARGYDVGRFLTKPLSVKKLRSILAEERVWEGS